MLHGRNLLIKIYSTRNISNILVRNIASFLKIYRVYSLRPRKTAVIGLGVKTKEW